MSICATIYPRFCNNASENRFRPAWFLIPSKSGELKSGLLMPLARKHIFYRCGFNGTGRQPSPLFCVVEY